MTLPVEPPVTPMLAQLQREIPHGEGWLYEPKWDGFRAIVFREHDRLEIASRNGQPLARYFPELVEVLSARLPERCVLDGEIVLAGPKGLEFETLQLRLHPAASRIRKLAQETPSSFTAFDLLAVGDDDVRPEPFSTRRARLVDSFEPDERCFHTPQTADPLEAARWFEQFEGAGLDGVVAKRAELPYVSRERVMVKVKHERTADCVVGGYRLAKGPPGGVGSLLLGLYDSEGHMHHVGFVSAFKARDRREILAKLEPLRSKSRFGPMSEPGAPSRWSGGKDLTWYPVEPVLVCEVAFDHMQGDRFRHGARLLRWRADKDPKDCTYDQLQPPKPFSLEQIVALAARARNAR